MHCRNTTAKQRNNARRALPTLRIQVTFFIASSRLGLGLMEIRQLVAHRGYPRRYPESALELLIRHPRVTPLVELKEESLEAHVREKVAKNVLAILAPLKARYVIISYDALSLRTARAMGAKRIGWVMRAWNEDSRARATELVPDYLICNYTKLPKDESQPLWFGPWQWMFYEVTQAKLAPRVAERGASFIETMAIGEMLKNAQLKRGSCLG